MLLNELIDTDRVRKIKKTDAFTALSLFRSLGEPLGSGSYATVYKGKRPNTVIKVTKVKDTNDPYIKYIRVIKDHQDNPFFPRIYRTKMYKVPDHRFTVAQNYFIVELEKLVPLDNEKIKDTMEPYLSTQLGIDDDRFRFHALADLTSEVEGRNKLRKLAKNPQFIEALDVLEDLFNNRSLFVDAHSNNWMVRLTGHGPQLVMTDPVAD